MIDPAFELNGKHPAERVFTAQARSSDVYLRGEKPPTPRQVAAVLHALADHTHNMHMLGPDVRALGADRDKYGEQFAQATALGRYFHKLGDALDRDPERGRTPAADEHAENI